MEAEKYLERHSQQRKQQISDNLKSKLNLLKSNFNKLSQVHRNDIYDHSRQYEQDLAYNINHNSQTVQHTSHKYQGMLLNKGHNQYDQTDEFIHQLNKLNVHQRNESQRTREQRKVQDFQQRKEAAQLVRQIQNDKRMRNNAQNQRFTQQMQKQTEAFQKANMALESARQNNSILAPSYTQIQEMFDLQNESTSSTKKKGSQRNRSDHQCQLTPQKLKWKPRVPLYKEIQMKYQQDQIIEERQQRQILLQIKDQRQPLEKLNLRKHQQQYDERLKDRANHAGADLFRQVRQGSLPDESDLQFDNDLVDSHIGRNRVVKNSSSMADKTEYEKYQKQMRLKEERRGNYAKYVKEINLPLELDRSELRKEASRLRLIDQIQQPRKLNSHLNDGVRQMSPELGNNNRFIDQMNKKLERNTTQQSKRTSKNNLPPINRHMIANSQNGSPLRESYQSSSLSVLPKQIMKQPLDTGLHNLPKKENKQWAKDFLDKNGTYLTDKEKANYVKVKADYIEQEAERLETRIKLPQKESDQDEILFASQMKQVYDAQQQVGDKLLDAIRAKLALLEQI